MSASPSDATHGTPTFFKVSLPVWIACAAAVLLGLFLFRNGIAFMLDVWEKREEYSHAYLIPFIALFLAWQRKNELAAIPFKGSWLGVAIVVLGVLIGLLDKLASVYTLQQLGLVIAICGFVLALTGWAGIRLLWMPLLLLFLMIPLPSFLQQAFSSGMQLWSSAIGVWFVRLMGISVYLEGNVIDLGTYKLQVAEACDGLRYLFPLMTLGLVMAFFYKGAMWKRVAVFLSSIPIAILMNSLRIAAIGWMVEHWGPSMAEGFLHDFQGWAVFMVSLALMVLVMIVLSRVGPDGKPWRELFGVEFPDPLPKGAHLVPRPLAATVIAACVVLVTGSVAAFAAPKRAEMVPARAPLVDFPMVIGQWFGERRSMEAKIIQVLKLNDYLIADYTGPTPRPINLYIAWYDSQRPGQSVHSPEVCIPAGGWKITELSQVEVPGVEAAGQPLRVNRAIIERGPSRQLVYYWFQQRGRIITNGYMLAWYLFWDSLVANRTDGALVRMVVPLGEGEQSSTADAELARFAKALEPALETHVPR